MKFIFEDMKCLGCEDHKGQAWKVSVFCNRCGKCCMDLDPDWIFYDKNKGCKYLEEEGDGKSYRCDLRVKWPFSCAVQSPFNIPDYCCIEMEKIDNLGELVSGK